MELTKIFTLIGIGLFGLLGILLIFTKSKRTLASVLLGLFFILWALNFLDGHLLLNGFYLEYPALALWEDPLVLLYGPLIYFYVNTLLRQTPPWKTRDFWHFLPCLFLYLVVIAVYHIQSSDLKLQILSDVLDMRQPKEVFFVTSLVMLHIMGYFYWSVRLSKKHSQQLKELYADTNVNWLLRSLKFLMILVGTSFLVSILQFYGTPLLFQLGLLLLNFLVLVFIANTVFKAFDEPELFAYRLWPERSQAAVDLELRKTLIQDLDHAMDTEQKYLDPELTLISLSNYLGQPPRLVSQAINQHYQQNFFEYINGYRIGAAQNLLSQGAGQKLTILEVLYQVGFNSKSSFNTQFKRITGFTPTQFKKLHQ